MPAGLLDILKYFLLALLWLFFLYAARMVLVDVRRSRPTGGDAQQSALRLRILEPKDHRGRIVELTDEVTIGRSPACSVSFADDTFASSVHARVFRRNGEVWLEDLGSTNGTYLNDKRLTGPARLERGDRMRVGRTVLEVRR